VGGYIEKYRDISPISIISVSCRIGALERRWRFFSIYHNVGDEWNVGNFSIFYLTFCDF